MKVANQIDEFLNSILLISENQHEVLIGSCTSGFSLTNTQEHILMLEAGTGGCLYSFSIAGFSEEADVGSSVLLGHCTRVGIF